MIASLMDFAMVVLRKIQQGKIKYANSYFTVSCLTLIYG